MGLVVSPVLLASLGVERFGLWALLWAITGSLGILDLRLAAAITPLAATAWARRETEELGHIFRTGIVFYGLLGSLEVIGAYWVTNLHLFAERVPPGLREEAGPALVMAVGVFALGSLTAALSGFLFALHRYDLRAQIYMSHAALRCLLLVVIALRGGGLRELLVAELLVAGLQMVATAWTIRRLLPRLRWIAFPDLGVLRRLVGFGVKLQVGHAAHLIGLHADKLLLSVLIGLEAVAYYDLGSKIAGLMRSLPLLLISATMPAASALEATGERRRVWNFYLTGTRILVYTGTPLLLFTLAGAGEILMAWAGVEALQARQTVWLLAVGYYINLVSGMANSVSVGIGKPELEMRRSLLAGGLNVVLSAALILVVGFPGAPLGTALALTAGSWYLMRAFNAEFGRPFSDVLRPFRRPLLLAVPAGAASLLALSLVQGGRLVALAELTGAALLIGPAYLWLLLRDGIVRREWVGSPGLARGPEMESAGPGEP